MKRDFLKLVVLLTAFVLCTTASTTFAESIQNFEAIASGVITYFGPEGCQESGTCTLTDEGKVKGEQIGNGTFTQTATVLFGAKFPNGGGGYCAPCSGSVTIIAPDGSALVVNRSGILCQVGDTSSYTANTAFFVTQGTGRFEGVRGSGALICSGSSDGKALATLHGTLLKNEDD